VNVRVGLIADVAFRYRGLTPVAIDPISDIKQLFKPIVAGCYNPEDWEPEATGERELSDAPSFKELERQGWGAKAGDYDAFAGQITVGAVAPLLDATGVRAGMRVLDVATGPGYVAAGADARGAHAVGIDFAANMVAEARRRFPGIEFREGDAENLAFDAATFDAVVCAFGLLHMPDPDKAIAEAHRVLRPGGGFAFTVWSGPDRHDFFAIVLKAVQTHGNMEVSLPPAPPIFRFSDPAECRNVLTLAGFVDASVVQLPLKWRAPSIEAILDAIYKSTVRTAAVLERQAPDALDRIHRAIREGAERFMRDGAYETAWPAVLATGRKPNQPRS
jgi:ubiquinone/menaquinone biosynthesis C-methylase UbiE